MAFFSGKHIFFNKLTLIFGVSLVFFDKNKFYLFFFLEHYFKLSKTERRAN